MRRMSSVATSRAHGILEEASHIAQVTRGRHISLGMARSVIIHIGRLGLILAFQ